MINHDSVAGGEAGWGFTVEMHRENIHFFQNQADKRFDFGM